MMMKMEMMLITMFLMMMKMLFSISVLQLLFFSQLR